MHKIISFVLSESSRARRGREAFPVQPLKSAPHYFEVSVPTQYMLDQKKIKIGEKEAEINIKFYQPDIVLVEAEMEIDNIFGEDTLALKNQMLDVCFEISKKQGGKKELSEEYAVYVVSKFGGEPEQFLKYSNKIAGLLKSEKLILDPQEIQHTLSYQLKYEKGDLTIIDWDGAFVFDADGEEIGETLELCELANYQLLKHRILDRDLDTRSDLMVKLIQKQPKKWFIFKTADISQSFKEIIKIRTQAISEFESMDRDIKLIGDWYSARLYDFLSKKLRLNDWHDTIREKLDSLEDIYTIASENLGMSRMQILESVQIGAWFVLQAGWLILIVLEFISFLKK